MFSSLSRTASRREGAPSSPRAALASTHPAAPSSPLVDGETLRRAQLKSASLTHQGGRRTASLTGPASPPGPVRRRPQVRSAVHPFVDGLQSIEIWLWRVVASTGTTTPIDFFGQNNHTGMDFYSQAESSDVGHGIPLRLGYSDNDIDLNSQAEEFPNFASTERCFWCAARLRASLRRQLRSWPWWRQLSM